MTFAVGSFVRVHRKEWVGQVLDVRDGLGRVYYCIAPVNPLPLESPYWWRECDVEPASILEAIAEVSA